MILHVPRSESGFSLIDVVVGLSVATVSLVGLGAVFVSTQRSFESAQDEAVRTQSFGLVMEQMRGENFADVGDLYTGYRFAVTEIGGTGTVQFFFDETADVPELGLPRDLDGDGAANSKDVSGSYTLLPIQVDIVADGETRSLFAFLSQDA